MFFQYKGIPIYYTVSGQGEPLLLLHGWGADSRCMRPLSEAMGKRFTVVTPDFPPFGLSGKPDGDWTVRDYADMVWALLADIGADAFSVIAHSFGGRVAAVMAAARPERVRRAVFCGAAGIPPKKTLKKRWRALRFKWARFWVRRGKKSAASLQKFYSADYRALSPELRQTFKNIVGEDLSADIALVRCPALLLWGKNDRETPPDMARQFNRLVKHSRLVWLSGGHFAFLDAAEAFTAEAMRFLTEQETDVDFDKKQSGDSE